MYPLPKLVEDDFATCPVLLLETYSPPGERGDGASILAPLEKGAYYPEGDSLWKHVNAKTRDRLVRLLQQNPEGLRQLGTDAEGIARMRPWFAEIMVGLVLWMNDGMKGELGVDEHFQEEAERVGKRIVGIETKEFQTNLYRAISSVSEKIQIQGLEAVIGIRKKASATCEKILVRNRNVHMADVAEQYLSASTPAFMVVGTAHLGGNSGLVHLIARRGYKVEKVMLSR